MTLATDLAIRKWKPTKDGEAIGTGGRTGLYVRGWKTGTKAFYGVVRQNELETGSC